MIQNIPDESHVCCCQSCLLSQHMHCIGISVKESIFGHASSWSLIWCMLYPDILCFLYYLCLIMPAHVATVQWRTDEQYFWKAVQLVIMRTSGKSAVLLQMLLYPHYADTRFKTEYPFYLSFQLLLFIILPQETGISATAELEQSAFWL